MSNRRHIIDHTPWHCWRSRFVSCITFIVFFSSSLFFCVDWVFILSRESTSSHTPSSSVVRFHLLFLRFSNSISDRSCAFVVYIVSTVGTVNTVSNSARIWCDEQHLNWKNFKYFFFFIESTLRVQCMCRRHVVLGPEKSDWKKKNKRHREISIERRWGDHFVYCWFWTLDSLWIISRMRNRLHMPVTRSQVSAILSFYF